MLRPRPVKQQQDYVRDKTLLLQRVFVIKNNLVQKNVKKWYDDQLRLALLLHLLHEKIQVFITFQHYLVTQRLVGTQQCWKQDQKYKTKTNGRFFQSKVNGRLSQSSIILSFNLRPQNRYGSDGWLARHVQNPTYVDSRAAQGLEAPPRTSTSHLATDPGSRPSSAQPRTELSMATRPGQRTIEAACGNGYAPVRGSPAMIMMMMMNKFKIIVIKSLQIRDGYPLMSKLLLHYITNLLTWP